MTGFFVGPPSRPHDRSSRTAARPRLPLTIRSSTAGRTPEYESNFSLPGGRCRRRWRHHHRPIIITIIVVVVISVVGAASSSSSSRHVDGQICYLTANQFEDSELSNTTEGRNGTVSSYPLCDCEPGSLTSASSAYGLGERRCKSRNTRRKRSSSRGGIDHISFSNAVYATAFINGTAENVVGRRTATIWAQPVTE